MTKDQNQKVKGIVMTSLYAAREHLKYPESMQLDALFEKAARLYQNDDDFRGLVKATVERICGAVMPEPFMPPTDAESKEPTWIRLPITIDPMYDKARLEGWGVILGDQCTDAPIFRHAQVPAGWYIKPTDGPLWSYLLDDRNFLRAAIYHNKTDNTALMRLAAIPE